jgi:hypothetical protein
LSAAEQQRMLDSAALLNYEKGRTIHGHDTQCLGMLILLQGVLRTYLLSEEGGRSRSTDSMRETSVFFRRPASYIRSHLTYISTPKRMPCSDYSSGARQRAVRVKRLCGKLLI